MLLTGCIGRPLRQVELAWRPSNQGLPSHGQVMALAFDPSEAGRLWAGLNSAEPLYLSDDGGVTWHPAGTGPSKAAATLPPPVYALLHPRRFPHVILAATGDGLYRSPDGGAAWEAVPFSPASSPVYALAEDLSGAIYLGGAGLTVFQSGDGGLHWEALSSLPEGQAILSLAVSPSAGWLLAGTDGRGMYSSRDGGETWQRVAPVGLTYVSSILMLASGAPPCSGPGICVLVRARSGLFRTLDGGETWQGIAATWNGRADAVAVVGNEPAWILATDRGGIYRSFDAEDWEPWGAGFGRKGAVFLLAPDPANTLHIFAGTENGLYGSSDGGLKWEPVAAGPGRPSGDALALAADGTLYLGNLDGVFASVDSGDTWEGRSVGLPPVPVAALAVAPSATDVLYAGTVGEGLFRSSDGGRSWAVTGWAGTTVPSIALDPQDPNRLYIRVAFERVYASEDGGRSFQARWTGLSTHTEIMSLLLDERRPNRLFAGGTDTLYRSTDAAASWQAVGPELAGQTVFVLLIDRANPEHLYAGATKGTYYSPDGGQTWHPWGRGLEDITVTALVFHPHNRDQVYAGTKYRGVYRSADGGRNWQPAGVGLGEASVSALLVSPDGRWLYAVTPQGFFRGEAR